MKRILYLLIILSIALFISCDEEDNPANGNENKPSMSGNWVDSLRSGSTTMKITMTLTQTYSVVNGSMQLVLSRVNEGVPETYEFSSEGVNGTNDNPVVELNAGKKGDLFKFNGQISADSKTMTGKINFQIAGEVRVYSYDMTFEKYYLPK